MPYALRLPDNGAYPLTPHKLVDPAPGSRLVILVTTPGELVPIDDRNISLEEARKWDADAGCPLELVQIDKNGKEVHHKAAEAETTDATEKGKD